MIELFEGSIKLEMVGGEQYMTLYGAFGTNLPLLISERLGKSALHSLMRSNKHNVISFHAYYALEVYTILTAIKDNHLEPLHINRKVLSNVLKKMEKTDNLKRIQHMGQDEDKSHHLKIANSKIIKSMNFKILPHQEIAFMNYLYMKTINDLRGMLLAAEPGTGKTYMSLALSLVLHSEKVVVICPSNTVESVWIDTLVGEMFIKKQDYWAPTLNEPYRGQKYIVVHYEYLGKLSKIIDNDGSNTAFIIDESHNLNLKGTKRTDELARLLNVIDPSDVILLSGTPIKGSNMEVSNILKYVDSKFSPKVEVIFEHLYKNPGPTLREILPMRYKYVNTYISKESMKLPATHTLDEIIVLDNGDYYTIDKIRERMKKYAETRMKFYANTKRSDEKEYVELRNKAYESAENSGKTDVDEFDTYVNDINEIISRYEDGSLNDIPKIVIRANAYEKNVLRKELRGDDLHRFTELKSIVKYVSLKIQGEVLARVVMRTRIDLSKDLAKVINYKKWLTLTEKKLLMFTAYGEVCEVVEKECGKLIKTAGVYWDTTPNLPEIVGQFHTDDSLGALVGTYKSLSTGIPIIAADITIFFDLPFKALEYSQAIARTSRLGQTNECYFIQVLLDTGNEMNINSRNVDIINMSKEIVEYITDKELNIEFKKIEVVESFLGSSSDLDGINYVIDMTKRFAPIVKRFTKAIW